MGYLSKRSRVIATDSTGVNVVNTTNETALHSTFTIPKTVAAGDVLRLVVVGDMINSSGSTVVYTFKLIIGATTLITFGTFSGSSAANRRRFRFEAEVLVVAPASDQRATSFLLIGTAAVPSGFSSSTSSTVDRGTATEDLTAGKAISFTAAMGTGVSTADIVSKEAWLEATKV